MALVDDGYAALGDLTRVLGGAGAITCHVFLNVRPTRDHRETWYRVAAEDALATRLSEAAAQSLTDIEARATGDQALTEFDFDAMVDGHIGALSMRDTPEITAWLDRLPRPDWPNVFDGDAETLSRLRFYAFRLDLPDGRIVRAFRGKAGFDIAARKRNSVVAAFHQETRELIAVEGPIITFDPSIDFFDWDGVLFVSNMRTFESITNVREITVRKSMEAVDILADRFEVGDVEGLRTQIQQRTRLGKRLASAHKHGLIGDLNSDEVVRLIAARRLRLVCDPHGPKLSFQIDYGDPRSVEDFVDLVSDVFLFSPTTHRDWEALAKRPPRRR